MNFTLVFCADGVLRARLSKDQPMIALNFLQKQEQVIEDWKWWAKWWEAKTVFEKGLTVANFLKALEPWKEYWDVAIGKSVSSYIQESRKPLLTGSKKTLDYVSIFYGTYVSEEIDFEDNRDESQSIEQFFEEKMRYCFTGWNTDAYYHMSGYIKGDENSYDVTFMMLNELANVEIYLDNKQYLSVSDTLMKKSLPHQRLLSKKAFAIRQCHDYYFIESSKEHRLRDVVEAFFWWMPKNAKMREEILEIIGVDDEHSESIENEGDKNAQISGIVIEPDCFSMINQHYENDQQYWQFMLSQYYQEKEMVRIGEVKPAILPEQRYGNTIINPKVIKSRYFD